MPKLIQKSSYSNCVRATAYAEYIATRENVELLNYTGYIAHRPHAERLGAHGLFGEEPQVDLNAVLDEISHYQGRVWKIIFSLERADAARLGYDHAMPWRDLLMAHQNEIATAMKIPPSDLRWYAAFHDEAHHPHIHMMIWSKDPDHAYLNKNGIEKIRSSLTNSIFQQEMLQLYKSKDISYKELVASAKVTMNELVAQMKRGVCCSPAIEQKMVMLVTELENVKGKKQYAYLPKDTKELVRSIVDELAQQPAVAECYEVWNNLRDQLELYYKDTARQHLPLSEQKEFRAILNAVIREAENLRTGKITVETFGHGSEEYRQGKAHLDNGDVENAKVFFQQAAESGDASAQYALGKILLTEGEKEAALHWLHESSSQGNPFATYLEENTDRDPGILMAATRLLSAAAGIFRTSPPPSNPKGIRMDSKRRKALLEKRMAMGHRIDDHEPTQYSDEQRYS